MSIERLLVTGRTESDLERFNLAVFFAAVNPLERRGMTLFCTCTADSLEHVTIAAKLARVTVQKRIEPPKGANITPADYWELVHQGDAQPWKP